jgi:hypothetical protein
LFEDSRETDAVADQLPPSQLCVAQWRGVTLFMGHRETTEQTPSVQREIVRPYTTKEQH